MAVVESEVNLEEYEVIELDKLDPVESTSEEWERQTDPGSKLLGCRLELKWSSGKWYRGTICEYNPTKRKHKVMYDDGDLRWYYLPEMVFRFVKEEEEWVKC